VGRNYVRRRRARERSSGFYFCYVMRDEKFHNDNGGSACKGDLISVLGQLRSLMERIAHLHFVTKFVSEKLQKVPDEDDTHPFISTFEIVTTACTP